MTATVLAGSVLLTCSSGCGADRIRAGLGLSWADLAPPMPTGHRIAQATERFLTRAAGRR